MALLTAANISAFTQTIWVDALTVARDNNLMVPLVTYYGDRTGIAPRGVSQYAQASIAQVGESDDMVPQTFDRTLLQQLTPAEYGGAFFFTDTRAETDQQDIQRDAAVELGGAMGQKIETDLLSNFASLTGGTVGAAGSAAIWGHLFAAVSRLRTRNAPPPYVAVLHPYCWHDLATAVAPGVAVTNSPSIQDEVIRRFYVGTVAGVEIYTSANISVDASDDAVSAVFSRQALVFDSRRAPRLEPQRDASRRGWELNMTAVYGHGVWRPTYGVQWIHDAVAPSF